MFVRNFGKNHPGKCGGIKKLLRTVTKKYFLVKSICFDSRDYCESNSNFKFDISRAD